MKSKYFLFLFIASGVVSTLGNPASDIFTHSKSPENAGTKINNEFVIAFKIDSNNNITDSAIRALDDKITLEYCDKKFKKMFKTTEIFSTFIPNSDESNKNSRKEESKMTLNVDHLNDHSNKTSFQLQEFTKYKEKRNELLGQVNNNLIGSTRVKKDSETNAVNTICELYTDVQNANKKEYYLVKVFTWFYETTDEFYTQHRSSCRRAFQNVNFDSLDFSASTELYESSAYEKMAMSAYSVSHDVYRYLLSHLFNETISDLKACGYREFYHHYNKFKPNDNYRSLTSKLQKEQEQIMSVLEGLPSESFNDVEGKFVNSENPDLNNRTSELLTYFKGQKSFTNIKIADLAQIVNKVQNNLTSDEDSKMTASVEDVTVVELIIFQYEHRPYHYSLKVTSFFEKSLGEDLILKANLKHLASCRQKYFDLNRSEVMKKLPTYYYGGVSKEFELAYVQSAWTLEREEFEQALQSFKPPEPPKQKRSSIISNMPGMSRRLTGNSCTSSKHGDLPVIQSNDSITENGKSWMCCNKLTCGILGGGSKF